MKSETNEEIEMDPRPTAGCTVILAVDQVRFCTVTQQGCWRTIAGMNGD